MNADLWFALKINNLFRDFNARRNSFVNFIRLKNIFSVAADTFTCNIFIQKISTQ